MSVIKPVCMTLMIVASWTNVLWAQESKESMTYLSEDRAMNVLLASEQIRIRELELQFEEILQEVIEALDLAQFELALELLNSFENRGSLSFSLRDKLKDSRAIIYLRKAEYHLRLNDVDKAENDAQIYEKIKGQDFILDKLKASIIKKKYELGLISFAVYQELNHKDKQELNDLLILAKNKYLASEYVAADTIFKSIEKRDPENAEVKEYLALIAEQLRYVSQLNHLKVKEQMLREVEQGWDRPRVFSHSLREEEIISNSDLKNKIETIFIPKVSFLGVPLSSVIDALSGLSEEYDSEEIGVNMVLINPAASDPLVHITLRNMTLNRVLEFVLESVAYDYEVQKDAVVIRQGNSSRSRLETQFFPVSRSTIIRLTGVGDEVRSSAKSIDPFSADIAINNVSDRSEEKRLKSFLQRAGIPFEGIEGATLALADGQLIVTQTRRNMERVRDVLRRYSEIKQVEIETRFLEVQQGDLEELGVNWEFRDRDYAESGGGQDLYSTSNRSLRTGIGQGDTSRNMVISSVDAITGATDSLNIPVAAPLITNTIDLATNAGNLATLSGSMGDLDVDVVVRALSRKTGNDLLSSPKITVLSGKTAEIVVAQELRFPERYTGVEADVGGGDSDSGSAGVAVTTGTPQNFTVRNVGVEMKVTPTVEENDSISLALEPKVTEFEGFVEFGGPSVAIASGKTVTVPSGFYQPIFSVREIRTEVTIWDGSTLIMGGLTREQAVSVDDKVPILGDIPFLGRLFRSKGDSTQKRNLLIFVTANLVSPGGAPMREEFLQKEAGGMYQSPVYVTPSGAVTR